MGGGSSSSGSSPAFPRLTQTSKQTYNAKRSGKLKPLQIEEWTEKLLEEARDDLEMVDVAVQTDKVEEVVPKTEEKLTQA